MRRQRHANVADDDIILCIAGRQLVGDVQERRQLFGSSVWELIAPTGYGIMLYVQPQSECTGSSGPALLGFTLIEVAVTSSRLTAVARRTSCNGFSLGTVNLSKR